MFKARVGDWKRTGLVLQSIKTAMLFSYIIWISRKKSHAKIAFALYFNPVNVYSIKCHRGVFFLILITKDSK
jgi:hypothetical protein